MWTAVPKSKTSWDYVINDAAQQLVGEVSVSDQERGAVQAGNVAHTVTRKGMLGAFLLQRGDAVVASAEKPSALRKEFQIEHEGRRFTLKKRSGWSREVVLFEGDRELGSIAPEGFFTTRAKVGLPEDLPIPLRLFSIWLTMLLWKRGADAADSGGD